MEGDELHGRIFRGIGEPPADAVAQLDGRRVQVLASPAHGNANRMSLGVTVLAERAQGSEHRHHGVEEAILVLVGAARFEVEGTVIDVAAGDAVLVPEGALHCVENSGRGEATLFWVYSPAGPECGIAGVDISGRP